MESKEDKPHEGVTEEDMVRKYGKEGLDVGAEILRDYARAVFEDYRQPWWRRMFNKARRRLQGRRL